MTNTDATTTVRLPHTGLQVPDNTLSVSAFKELSTHCGVAYTANLRHRNRIVGTIENGGTGGMTMFHANDWRTFGEKELEAYAARCRTEEGEDVTVENLLDELIDEHDWARKVATAARHEKLQLRLMEQAIAGFPPFAHGEARGKVPANAKQWEDLTAQVLAKMPPGDNGWWQAWTGKGWKDVTPRPAGVSAELYG